MNTILNLNKKDFEIILNWFENSNYIYNNYDYLMILNSTKDYYRLSINNNILNEANNQLIKESKSMKLNKINYNFFTEIFSINVKPKKKNTRFNKLKNKANHLGLILEKDGREYELSNDSNGVTAICKTLNEVCYTIENFKITSSL